MATVVGEMMPLMPGLAARAACKLDVASAAESEGGLIMAANVILEYFDMERSDFN